MKKVTALLLAFLMVVSIGLTACTTGTTKETGTEKGTDASTNKPEESSTTGTPESSTESGTESGSESTVDPTTSPTLADGNIIHVLIKLPAYVEKDTDGSGWVRVDYTITVEVEYNKADKTFRMEFSSDNKDYGIGSLTKLSVYFDGTYLYMETKDMKGITTPEVFIESVLNQMVEMDESMAQMLEDYIEKLMNGDVSGLPATPDLDTILGMLPEEYQELVRQILDLLPEGGVEMPDVTLPKIDPAELIGKLIGLCEKTETEDGGAVYTFDFTTVTTALTGILDQVPALLEMTPAAFINQLAGKDGTYEQVFLLLSTSIKGDTTVGSILDQMFLVLNAQGFRITDEKIVKMIETVAKLSGQELADGQAEEMYKSARKLTLDELLAFVGGSQTDTPLTVAGILGTVNTFMTESTFAQLIDMIGEGTSDKILSAVEQAKEALSSVSGSLCFHAGKDNAIYRVTFELTVGENSRMSAEVTISDTPVMTVPENLPDVSGITVSESENGDLEFKGLPEGATVKIVPDGYWRFECENEYWGSGSFEELDTTGYLTVSGSTVSVKLSALPGIIDKLLESQTELAGNPEKYNFVYKLNVTVSITLADGTTVLLYPAISERGSFKYITPLD